MTATNTPTARSSRTTIKRAKHKARYDREVVNAIFDEALICHVGFVADGSPFVIPTIHARVGDILYFRAFDPVHGIELWRSDGTETGTYRLTNINPGSGNSLPAFLTEAGGTLFFQARDVAG